jgi:hypothetical protein
MAAPLKADKDSTQRLSNKMIGRGMCTAIPYAVERGTLFYQHGRGARGITAHSRKNKELSSYDAAYVSEVE